MAVDYTGGDSATVYATTQGTFTIPKDAADALGLPESAVTSTVQHMGGGFGSKFGIGIEGLLACKLSRQTKAPVKLMLTRYDEFVMAGNRSGSWQKLKAGVKNDGTLIALQARQYRLGGLGGGSQAGQPYVYQAVDFYREVGYLPDAIINYLMLLGWSLDDKTEDFSRDEMIKHFTLERVTKSPASFDCKKLWVFQDRYMQRLPLKQKVAKMLPYLQKAGLIADPAPCEVGPKLTRIVKAAGDRLKTITGSTSNGVIKVHWDLTDDHGLKCTNNAYGTLIHITLPDSGRSQKLKGP